MAFTTIDAYADKLVAYAQPLWNSLNTNLPTVANAVSSVSSVVFHRYPCAAVTLLSTYCTFKDAYPRFKLREKANDSEGKEVLKLRGVKEILISLTNIHLRAALKPFVATLLAAYVTRRVW